MSMFAPGQDVKYTSVRVKILKCENPQSWYAPLVGQSIIVNRKQWFQDGEPTSMSYEMPRTPGGGFNGHIMTDDLEER